MNCAKSVKMIVILGCIVVNLVGCGMNDTTASSMSTVVSSQDTSSSSCNSEEKNDLQDFSQTLVDSTSVFLDQDQYTVFEKAQKIDYALWGQSSNLKGLNFKIEDAPTFVPMTQNAPTYAREFFWGRNRKDGIPFGGADEGSTPGASERKIFQGHCYLQYFSAGALRAWGVFGADPSGRL